MCLVPHCLRRSLLVVAACAATFGCEPQFVQYRTKPTYHNQMAASSFKDGVTRDGVEIRWVDPVRTNVDGFEQSIGGQTFRIREEREDGTIVLRGRIPHHVLVNTLACLRNSEYRLLWDQLLASSTRSFYEQQEDGYQNYEVHLRKHRRGMASLVNRMVVGQTYGELIVNESADGTIQCRLRKRLEKRFKFKEVLMVKEGGELKLLTIR